jgi:hypothetical protein
MVSGSRDQIEPDLSGADRPPQERHLPFRGLFDRAGRETEELVDDLDCLAGLIADGEAQTVRQSWQRRYRVPEQETKLRPVAGINVATEEGPRNATLAEHDQRTGSALVRFSKKNFETAPDRIDLLPSGPIRTGAIEEAIHRVVDDLCADGGRFRAVHDLLQNAPPRFSPVRQGPILNGGDLVAGTVAAIADLDHGVLPIQGPPGTGKGNCYDNAVVEAFFKTIKFELIWPVAWQTRRQAENAVARYIDGFYNPVRRHSTLGYQSPVQFEIAGRE